jgi:hypothetical protein
MEKKVWETPKLDKLDVMVDTLTGSGSGGDILGGS